MQKRKVGIEAETFTQQKAPVFERALHGFYGLAVCDRQAHVPLSRTSRGLRVGTLLNAKASERPAPPAPHPDPRRYTSKQPFVFLGGFYSVAGWKRRSGVAASSFSCWVVSPWEKKNKQ